MSTAFPTRPGEVPDVPFTELADLYHGHIYRLVDAHHGIGDPVPAAELAGHAVAALATQHALSERVLYSRWCTARDALVYGATIPAVAAGMGLDVDEVVMGLRLWVDGQFREHQMSSALRDEVLALVEGPEVTG